MLWIILKVQYKRNSEFVKKYQNVIESDVTKPVCVFPVHTDESSKVATSRQSEIVEPMRSPKLGNRRNVSWTANAQSECDCLTDLMFKVRWTCFLYRHFESVALSRSPRQPSMESRIWRLEKFKLVSNGNITNKITCFDVYGDINLVVTWSGCHKIKSGILFVKLRKSWHVFETLYYMHMHFLRHDDCINYLLSHYVIGTPVILIWIKFDKAMDLLKMVYGNVLPFNMNDFFKKCYPT